MPLNSNKEKMSFAAYIARKRKSAGLTQEELAKKLFVTHTTVSKWERGLSYPDIALVTGICRELNISEHEFFTACDDVAASKQKKDAEAYRTFWHRFQKFFEFSYAATLIVCFICNLVIYHTLSWFWIVLTALALSFCFTILPQMLDKNKKTVSLGAATGCLFLLLFSIWAYVGGTQFGFAIAVTALSFVLPWGWYIIWFFVPQMFSHETRVTDASGAEIHIHSGRTAVKVASMILFTVWSLLLTLLCVGAVGGPVIPALQIAVISNIPVWGIFSAVVFIKVNQCFKVGAVMIICGFAIPFINISLGSLLQSQNIKTECIGSWSCYFNPAEVLQTVPDGTLANRICFVSALAVGLMLIIIGTVLYIRKDKTERK